MWPLKKAPQEPDLAWIQGSPDGYLDRGPGEPLEPIYLTDGIRPDVAEFQPLSDKDAVAVLLASRRGPEDPFTFEGLDMAEDADLWGYRASHEERLAAVEALREAERRMASLKPWQVKTLAYMDRAHAALERRIVHRR